MAYNYTFDLRRPKNTGCMGVLLDEETVLIDSFCDQSAQFFSMRVLVSSYNTADFSSVELKKGSSRYLDTAAPVREELRVMKLSSSVTLDKRCALPACVPNKEIIAEEIDFDDCRFVGYGATSSSAGGAPVKRLMEVEVTIDKSSVAKNQLTVTRKTGPSQTGPCLVSIAIEIEAKAA
ncbi:hypothetical protein ElyMa_003626800 [Elysia marginata]|uniref:Peptidase S1 domain-containing protein n=1 Tax=Elysia marginata TaxID=1093978 RepID=A0AAV4EVL0_9GAST|nr:hypothetical protein ElyMa_003626800 [Elysia marginata]